MLNPDYGPVPVSQLKAETGRIFAALSADRRVLISRRGEVVAAIEPASVARFTRELAAFALPGDSPFAELTASDLSQGSPSESVRAAEAGSPAFVTRNNKVYGVLAALPQPPLTAPGTYEAWLAGRERALAAFAAQHPDATPEEFADAAAAYPAFTAAESSMEAFARPDLPLPTAAARAIAGEPGPGAAADDDVLDESTLGAHFTRIRRRVDRVLIEAQRELDLLLATAAAPTRPTPTPARRRAAQPGANG